MVYGLGLRVQGLGSGSRVQGLRFRVNGSGCKGLGLRVRGLGFRV